MITDNGFAGNNGEGGGIYLAFADTALVEGNLVVGNTGRDGAGIYVRTGGTLVNNTIQGNTAGSAGRGGGVFIEVSNTPVEVVNCIIWGNQAGDGEDQIHLTDSGLADVSFSCVQGGFTGDSNIAFNPKFVSVATGDFRLDADSPCIDTGDDFASTAGVTDVDGNTRIVGVAIDMGCYERQGESNRCFGDVNGDGMVDGADLALVLADFGSKGKTLPGDLNGDGLVDGADLAGVLSAWGPCP